MPVAPVRVALATPVSHMPVARGIARTPGAVERAAGLCDTPDRNSEGVGDENGAMTSAEQIRPGERTATLPDPFDAGLWMRRADGPKPGARAEGSICRIGLDPRRADALTGLEAGQPLRCLYWMDRARRALTLQSPRRDGTFALRPNRSPVPR